MLITRSIQTTSNFNVNLFIFSTCYVTLQFLWSLDFSSNMYFSSFWLKWMLRYLKELDTHVFCFVFIRICNSSTFSSTLVVPPHQYSYSLKLLSIKRSKMIELFKSYYKWKWHLHMKQLNMKQLHTKLQHMKHLIICI